MLFLQPKLAYRFLLPFPVNTAFPERRMNASLLFAVHSKLKKKKKSLAWCFNYLDQNTCPHQNSSSFSLRTTYLLLMFLLLSFSTYHKSLVCLLFFFTRQQKEITSWTLRTGPQPCSYFPFLFPHRILDKACFFHRHGKHSLFLWNMCETLTIKIHQNEMKIDLSLPSLSLNKPLKKLSQANKQLPWKFWQYQNTPFYFTLISSETEVQVKASVFIRIALLFHFLSVSLSTHLRIKQDNVLFFFLIIIIF